MNKKAKVISLIIALSIILSEVFVLVKPEYVDARWNWSKNLNTMYEMKPNSIEVLAAGASTCTAGVSPFQLYEEYGISAYNLSAMSEPMIGTYYWIKECYQTQNPKVVLVEVQTAGRRNKKKEEKFRKCYDYMRCGLNKLEFALTYCYQSDNANIMEYLFPISKYGVTLRQSTSSDTAFAAGDTISVTRGFDAWSKLSGKEYKGLDINSDKMPKKVSIQDIKYLEKIIDFCKSKGSEVVLFRSPDSSWKVDKHNLIQKIADKKKVEFIDFNTKSMMEEIGFDFEVDAWDGMHVNVVGAKKETAYIGKYLNKHFELTDFRKTDEALNFSNELQAYKAYYDVAIAKYKQNKADYKK